MNTATFPYTHTARFTQFLPLLHFSSVFLPPSSTRILAFTFPFLLPNLVKNISQKPQTLFVLDLHSIQILAIRELFILGTSIFAHPHGSNMVRHSRKIRRNEKGAKAVRNTLALRMHFTKPKLLL